MLKFIECGSAFNTELGNNSAFFKTDNEQTFNLIDCGESVFKSIKEKGLLEGVEQVNVFTTHLHSDHCGSLSSLIYFCYYVLKIKVIIFYPSSDLDLLLKLQGMTGEEYLYKELNEVELVEYNVDFEKVKHIDDSCCYSLIIKNNLDGCVIYYSGDTKDTYVPCHRYDLIYHDISSFGGVHPKFEDFHEKNMAYRTKIIMMHFDSSETIDKCKESGYGIATDFLIK